MTLDELERRLSEATGPDRELGVAVYETLEICSYIPDEGDPTASLDAAVALCERVLPNPDWFWRVNSIYGGAQARINQMLDSENGLEVYGSGRTPALALLLATVRALKAKG